IESYLKKISNPDILIFGCTYNYRKLLAKYKLFATMVDITREMYKINTEAIKNIKRKEKFIEANWLTVRLKKKYDLILGDFVTSNVPLSKRNKFLENVKRHLKDNGLFITRIYNTPKKLISEKEFLKYYKNKKITLQNLNDLWWDSVFQLDFNKKSRTIKCRRGILNFKRLLKKHPYLKKWLEPYEKYMLTEKKDWTALPEDKQEKQLKKYFKIIAKKSAKDYRHWEDCVTYILKK
ncbi:class I SAM-dependent methyltransferase, partial [Candidatus Woesearchaeota archaeon]|nr:class I SAM-dependent methyltransferase [Candidatus Woesearchaeota archaeon]